MKNEKRLEYLFLNLVYLLRESNETIQYGSPQYGNPDTGFSITMYHVDHDGYEYAQECLRIMGIEPLRECGVTISVSFATPEENDEFRKLFEAYLDHAEAKLSELNGRTPKEFYALKTKPIIREVVSTDSNHIVGLAANIHDDVDKLALCEMLEPWADYKRIRDYFEISVKDDGNAEIQVVFYRIRKQRKFVTYLEKMGLGEE